LGQYSLKAVSVFLGKFVDAGRDPCDVPHDINALISNVFHDLPYLLGANLKMVDSNFFLHWLFFNEGKVSAFCVIGHAICLSTVAGVFDENGCGWRIKVN